MSQELRKIFETFLKDFKKTYNDKILLVVSDLRYNMFMVYKKHKDSMFMKGYIEALKDVEKVVKRFK